MAKLQRAVILRDPNRARDLTFQPGDEPDLEYAVLITNPHCWEGDKLPTAVERHLAAKKAAEEGQQVAPATTLQQTDPTQEQDDASGADSADGEDTAPAAPAAKKTAARKTAASKPARGREAADQGDSGE